MHKFQISSKVPRLVFDFWIYRPTGENSRQALNCHNQPPIMEGNPSRWVRKSHRQVSSMKMHSKSIFQALTFTFFIALCP